MIKNIYVFMLDLDKWEPLDCLFQKNEQRLRSHGFITIQPTIPDFRGRREDIKEITKRSVPFAEYGKELLRLTESEGQELIFNISNYGRMSLKIAAFLKTIEEFFEKAHIQFYTQFTPPDIQLENSLFMGLSRGYSLNIRNVLLRFNNTEPTINSFFALFDETGVVKPHLLNYAQTANLKNFTESVLQIELEDAPAPFGCNPDAIRFMELVNMAFGEHGEKKGPLWLKETEFLRNDPAPFFSPETRAFIDEMYWLKDGSKPQKTDARHYFKLPTLMRDREYEHWREPGPVTWSWACDMASRLSPELREVIADMEPLAPMLPNSALCLDAIKAVSGKASFVPTRRGRPKVSVLTACFNHAKYVGQCIESVLEQNTDFEIEHIIGDDGSTDGSQDIIMEYASKNPSIKPILQKKNKGPAINYALLFENAAGEYVSICDGDDWFCDNKKLQIQSDLLDSDPQTSLCFHPVKILDEEYPEREESYPPLDLMPRGVRPFYYFADLIKCNIIQTNSVLYRWRFKNGVSDWVRTDLCPSDWYMHLLHAEQGKIAFLNRVMSCYRIHAKGVYYLSHRDRIQHRYNTGFKEMETYDAINRHFSGKYFKILGDLAGGVLSDCMRYDVQTEKSGDDDPIPTVSKLIKRFPVFGAYFLDELKKKNGGRL